MNRRELVEMAEAYMDEHGFKPGALVVFRDDVEELADLFSDSERVRQHYLESIRESPDKARFFKACGMGIEVTSEKKDIHLRRYTGISQRIRPQGMGEMYNPVADITNSLPKIFAASFSFFDESGEDDERFLKFSEDCAVFLNEAKTGSSDWRESALPYLQKVMSDFKDDIQSDAFFKKFFMCVMDFYWHCVRLSPLEPATGKKKELWKALDISGLLRTMPEDMRSAYMDHLGTYGMLPDLMSRRGEENEDM